MKKNSVSLLIAPLLWLRLEGLLALVTGIFVYRSLGGPWWGLPLGFLADLSFAAYLMGPRTGALVYNLTHALVLPVLLGLLGWAFATPLAVLIALVWSAHIGLDRLLGYGLKHPDAFGHTHLTPTAADLAH